MPLTSLSDDLKSILNRPKVKQYIKDNYITEKLFVDSAIRQKLRTLAIEGVGDDEIIAHLQKLEESKSRRLDKSALAHVRRNHERRIRRAKERLDNPHEN